MRKSLVKLKGENIGIKEMSRTCCLVYERSIYRVKDHISVMSYEEFESILRNYKHSLEEDEWNWLEK